MCEHERPIFGKISVEIILGIGTIVVWSSITNFHINYLVCRAIDKLMSSFDPCFEPDTLIGPHLVLLITE